MATSEEIQRKQAEAERRRETLGRAIRGVVVTVECWNCKGSRRLPGGPYKSQGEVIPCPICDGRGTTREEVETSLLYDVLTGNLR